jgi:hypothetical protein
MDTEAFLTAVAQVIPALMIAHVLEFPQASGRVLDRARQARDYERFAEYQPALICVARVVGGFLAFGELAALSVLLFDGMPRWAVLGLTAAAALSTTVAITALAGAPVRRIAEIRPPEPPMS